MKFIALKTKDGELKGDIAFYCRSLHVSRQGFYQYLANKGRPWKYQSLADAMKEILAEDECNDTYGRIRMYQALTLKQPEHVDIPSERTVYRVMGEIGISHHPKRKPNGITKEDREARKSEDLLKRNFHAEEPLVKCVTDITEIKARDGKLYVSAIFEVPVRPGFPGVSNHGVRGYLLGAGSDHLHLRGPLRGDLGLHGVHSASVLRIIQDRQPLKESVRGALKEA